MHRIQPSRFPHGEVPNCANLLPAEAQTFLKGRVLTRTGAEVLVHPLGATVTGVYGVALGPATDGRAVGPDPRVVVAKADRQTEFLGQVYRVSTTSIEDVDDTMIGDTYGLVVVDGETWIDVEDVTNVLIEVTDVKAELNAVLFKFLETAIQEV